MFSSSSKSSGWGGSRANAGGARPNAGGPRANSGGARANSGGARPGSGPKTKKIADARTPENSGRSLESGQGISLETQAKLEAPRWYCVRTGHGAEITADIEIRLAGFTLFAPTVWKPATKPRRLTNGAIQPGKPDRIVPLFPRYLFVRFHRLDDPWRRIRSLRGVEAILSSTPESPIAVPDAAIEAIRGQCAPNGCIYPLDLATKAAAPLAVGTIARLTEGPMADLTGICSWSDGKRVRLLLEIMGRAVLVTVAQSAVVASPA